MKIVNEQEFQDTIKQEHLVLVDFYADWCGPCKMMAPVLEEAEAENNFTVIKVNVDEHPGLAGQYGVQSIPNMVLFKDAIPVNQIIGFMSKDALLAQLQKDL